MSGKIYCEISSGFNLPEGKIDKSFSAQYTFLSGVMEKKAQIVYAKFNVHGLPGKLGSLYQFRR